MTAIENVEYSLNVKGQKGHGARAEAERVLARVGLGDRLHFLPRDLSGGQKQRVAIARALAGSPQVLLADEPTANLDSNTGAEIIALMRKMQREHDVSFVFSSHDPQVQAAADDVVFIRDGRIVGAGQQPGAAGGTA